MINSWYLKFGTRLVRISFSGLFLSTLVVAHKANAQFIIPSTNVASDSIVKNVQVVGNQTVSTEAILNAMSLKANSLITQEAIAKDIKSIFSTGYFQDVEINQSSPGELTVQVLEKPTINEISYVGFNIISNSSLKDKIHSKKYTIVDEKKLSQDLRAIDQAYTEKGYYLAKSTYTLIEIQPGVVNVIFKVTENNSIAVRNVSLVGNETFSDNEIYAFMGTKPFSWASFFGMAGLFNDQFLQADQQNITYFMRDNGYAEATVAAPIALLNRNKTDIDVSFYIEQGEKYRVGTIAIEGDDENDKDKIKSVLTLKEGEYYRISKFNNDMKALKNFYGDQGYAFAYVYPRINLDRKTHIYNITYTINKGKKAYIRNIIIEGNLKTRDNVIRRAMKISEGELFNATKIEQSHDAVNRLGFFDKDVVPLQIPDAAHNAVDLKLTVKEKSTGSLQASIGASPDTTSGSKVTFFGSLQYQESNFLGRAYGLGVNLQLSPSPQQGGSYNYSIGLNFTNPSIYDGPWSYSVDTKFSKQDQSITTIVGVDDAYITTKTTSVGFLVGRGLTDNFRISLGLTTAYNDVSPPMPLTQKFYASGKTTEFAQNARYDNTDNYMNPTSGLSWSVGNTLGLKALGGDYDYGVASGNVSYYLPLNYTENIKTNFRFAFIPRYAYQLHKDQPLPIWKRLQLGNMYQMKGYAGAGKTITPTIPVLVSPVSGQVIPLIYGGDKSLYGVAEYFVPIVPEAGLRFVTFAEFGEVLLESEKISLSAVKTDVGFGFRWTTPIAPFRFEWAYPVENGHLGDVQFVFTIGYDSFGGS